MTNAYRVSMLTFSPARFAIVAQAKQQLIKVACRASEIIGCDLPSIASYYAITMASRIVSDPFHLTHHLLSLLPTGIGSIN